MPTPPTTVQAFDEGARFRVLRTMLEDPTWLLEQIGALVLAQTQRAFIEQRMGDVRWKTRDETRMNPNWPAVIADVNAGRRPPARRFQGVPALIDTSRLRRSFAYRVTGRDAVEVGTNLPYASPLHFGTSSQTQGITKAGQERLVDFIEGAQAAAQRALLAPARRVAKGDAATDARLAALHADLARSVASYGDKPSKGERERRARIRQDIKARKEQILRAAAGRAVPTPKEATAAQKASLVASGAPKLRWLTDPDVRGRKFTIRHPARPMVGLPASLVSDIETLVPVKIEKGAA